jgi:hypothetical protein
VGQELQFFTVFWAKTNIGKTLLEIARGYLDRRIEIFIVERHYEIERTGIRRSAQPRGKGAGCHGSGVTDNSVDVEQDAVCGADPVADLFPFHRVANIAIIGLVDDSKQRIRVFASEVL